jgi:ELWxxDGT repeat protein
MRERAVVTLAVLVCLWPALASAISAPRLVADFATVVSSRAGSEPSEFVRVGSFVLFTARPDDHARRLFRSDGTAAGTIELANGCGPLDTGGFELRFTTASLAYYAVNCAGGGEALWASDGTPAGTRVLLAPGSYYTPGSQISVERRIEEEGGTFFLQGGWYDRPLELWRTDGTAAGTARVAVVSTSDSVRAGLHRRAANDLLMLVEETSRELVVWHSDGTSDGTVAVRSLAFPDQNASLRSFTGIADGIAFTVSLSEPSRVELWYSDGTAAGTALGAVLPIGVTDEPVAHAGSIYFTAAVGWTEWVWRGDGTEATTRPIVPLGSRDARTASFEFFDGGLYLVACGDDRRSCNLLRAPLEGGIATEIAETCDSHSCESYDDELWVRGVGGRLLFTRRDEFSVAVWSSALDGTGATQVKTLCEADLCFAPNVQPVVLDAALFFATVTDEALARELWTSDGTPAGTLRLAGPLAGIQWYVYPYAWEPIAALPGGGGWVFAGADTEHGIELWRARSQADSGAMVEDLRPDRPGLFNPEPVGAVGSTFVFALASDDGDERTLYRHAIDDGPVEPFLTVPVHRGRHGIRNAPPALRAAGNAWFFIEHDLGDEGPFAEQIWRYDPVSRDLRTLFADDPRVTGIGARADDLLPSGTDYLFLGSTDPELHPAIYRLRPRSGAISKLMDLPAEHATSVGQSGDFWYLVENGERVVAVDLARRTRKVLGDFPGAWVTQAVTLADGLVFTVDWQATGEGTGLELRQSSGDGTRLVAQWPSIVDGCPFYLGLPPKGSASPALFAAQTYCANQTADLWVSDGSFDRTRRLRSFPGEQLDFARQADRLRGDLFFLASRWDIATQTSTYEIWKSDGTPTGTLAVADLPAEPNSGSYNFTEAARGAEGIYFAWSDAVHGGELWRTDGTSAGTGLAADIEPGPESSSPWQLRTVGDQVIFRAGTAATGLELWQVDGGFPTAQPVADLYPGIESSAPIALGTTGEALYFLADDGVVGREIWEVDRPSVAPCVADATTLCLADGRFRARAVRRDFAGELGTAGVVPLTGDSGYFWFFAPGNPEVLLKIVDACGLPGFENFWAYSTGLTNVEVELEVVDTSTGERKVVRTALGEAYGPLFDSGSFQVCAFGGAGAGGAPAPASAADAVLSTVLPLLDGRFEARASWRKRDGTTGVATAVPFTADSGYFWFFDPAIVEVLVKMVDACGFEGFDNFWVFAGGLTDVEVHLEVTDTWSGEVVRHDNLQGQPFPTLLETRKLRVCAARTSKPAESAERH